MFKNAEIINIFWLLIDKAFLLIGSFIVSVMVARYLGPENLGFISYGVALGTFAIAICQWGANYTIYDTATRNKVRSSRYIISTEKVRFYLYIVVFIIVSSWVYFSSEASVENYLLIVFVFFTQIFLGLEIYQYYYNGVLKSKINATSSIFSKLISMSMRVAFTIKGLNVFYFVIPFFVEGGMAYWLRKRKFNNERLNHRSNKYRNHYFGIGIPLVMTGVFVVIYSKINEVMLANFVSYEALGVFSIAITLNSAWTFVPMSVGISMLAKPMKENNEEIKMLGYSFVTLVIIITALPMLTLIYFLSDLIIKFTFGIKYIEASSILFILSCGSLFMVLGFITNRMINSMQGGRYFLLKKVAVSSVIMIPLSYYLVNRYHLYGAAVGYVMSEFLNLTLLNYFFLKGKFFHIHLNVFKSLSYRYKYTNSN
jgi:O-antigen/teichoic acid export membrane protein